MAGKKICPVCGKSETNEDEYEVCPVCHWAADSYQRRHPDETGENVISLNGAKRNYAKHGTI